MIRIAHLRKSFGRFVAVDDVSFDVKAGESVALWGPNGAGKTTIIRCLLGLHRCDGHMEIAGIDAGRRGKAARRAIGYVPQELAFYDDMRAGDALRLFARLKGAAAKRVNAALVEVQLEEHGRKRIRELSGGMKQRLALASALLADPPVLVLDELTSNLDAHSQSAFMDLLLTQQNRGKTILFTSHHFGEVQALADRVLFMERGRIVRDAVPESTDSASAALSVLKLFMGRELVDQAVQTLVLQGFAATRNGRSVSVPVRAGERAMPIQALRSVNIEVHDFDLAVEPPSLRGGGYRHD